MMTYTKEESNSGLSVAVLRLYDADMHISWHGHYTVKIQSGETTLVIDPYSPSVGLPPFRAKADIVALSNPYQADMSHTAAIQGEPRLIKTPGEYALSGFTLHALGWYDGEGREHSLQRWHIEDIVLLYVGALNRDIADAELQELERTNVDVLIVPIGGGSGLTSAQAVNLITKVEPRIVVPIHFQLPHLKEKLDTVEQFAKEMGVDPKAAEKKLVLKAKHIPQEELATHILMP